MPRRTPARQARFVVGDFCSSFLSAPQGSVETELVTIMLRVLVALLEHILYISAGFRVGNVVQLKARASPGVDVGLAGVVGSQGGDLVVVEPLDQVVEVEGPVADVDVGV